MNLLAPFVLTLFGLSLSHDMSDKTKALDNNMVLSWDPIVWCFDCTCNQGSGECYVVVAESTAECDAGNYEGACTGGCSLTMYRATGPCPNGGGPRQ